jgi:uncharacterized protein YutE (UPF0331/DUF86 family)
MVQRPINTLFNQRFFLGVYAPFILEFIVYAIYTATSGIEFNFVSLLWSLMLIAPALFIYMISPIFIYYICGIGNVYEKNLRENIDELFIFHDDIEGLVKEQQNEIRTAIEEKLIPNLVKNAQSVYIDSYISRTNKTQKDNLLSSFETLFLFSIIWSILSLADFIGVIILHYTPIKLDFMELDQISNPVNVAVFAIIFLALTAISDIVAYYSLNRLRKLILETLPVVVFIEEEERIKQDNYLRAIGQFPILKFFPEKVLRRHRDRIDPIFANVLSDPLAETIQSYAQNQVAKQQAWRIYQPILDNLEVSDEQTAVIKDRFFKGPLYDLARGVFTYDHEVNSLKTDIEYVKNRLSLWDEISEEEHSTAMVFLFRSAEQLFKSILDQLGIPPTGYSNFSLILKGLKEYKIINDEEIEILNNLRGKRNTLVHQSGRIVKIEKEDIEESLKVLERILIRADRVFDKERKSKIEKDNK